MIRINFNEIITTSISIIFIIILSSLLFHTFPVSRNILCYIWKKKKEKEKDKNESSRSQALQSQPYAVPFFFCRWNKCSLDNVVLNYDISTARLQSHAFQVCWRICLCVSNGEKRFKKKNERNHIKIGAKKIYMYIFLSMSTTYMAKI